MTLSLYPLILSARKGNYRKFQARRQNKNFMAIKQKILVRDQNTCRFCGFKSDKYQEVVNIDQNYSNNVAPNLATACSFCTQCFFLDAIGSDASMNGEVIHLPEISQADLNNFCRVLFCSMDKDTPYKNRLQAIYLSLKDRTNAIDNCFGPDSHDPNIFGQGLVDTNLSEEELRHPLLREVRLLPIKKNFKEQIDYWKKTVFAKIPL